MKMLLPLFCFLFSSLTWGQAAAVPVLTGQPQPLRQASHPEHAGQVPNSPYQNLLGVNAYSYA